MAAETPIFLSVIVGYRNRNLERIERFLDGLETQTFRAFELIFIDYGSSRQLAQKAEQRVTRFRWARYFFNETTGMPWNRGHALNSAARLAKGDYLLCTDIDLIFSSTVFGRLIEIADKRSLLGAQFQLLPKSFRGWERLSSGSITGYPLSHSNTMGAIQLVSREVFGQVQGFDEFYRIWGVEDFDFNTRLKRAGIKIRLVSLPPVYHQWHTSSAVPQMPIGWLEMMNFHCFCRPKDESSFNDDWGKCLTECDRPSLFPPNKSRIVYEFVFPKRPVKIDSFAPWGKIALIRDLLGKIKDSPSGSLFIIEFRFSFSDILKENFAKLIAPFRFRSLAGSRFFNYRHDGYSILWYTAVLSGLIQDYSINAGHRCIKFLFVRK